MTRFMYDSTEADRIPADAQMVACYVNGKFANAAAVRDRFPHAVIVCIDVNGTDWEQASVLDVETGDATPATAAEWIRKRNAFRPGTATIYCNRSTIGAVRAACAGESYFLWVATLDGEQLPGEGYAAVQFKGGVNAPYDESVVYDDAWHPSR